MEIQILDADYTLVNNKPIVRIYGKDIDGKSVSVFHENFLPYFYLDVKKEYDMKDVIYEFENMGLKVQIVDKMLPIGYSESMFKVLKITGIDPGKISELRETSKRFGTPYEADILFKYRYLVDHKLRGMNWVRVDGESISTKTVKCKAVKAKKIEPIERFDNAPLRYMALDIECMPEKDRIAEPDKDPIIIISLYFEPEYRGCKQMVLLSKNASFGKDTMGFSEEKEMMQKFLDIINSYDPDILIGYNINNFDLPYIIKRLEVLNLPKDLGRCDKPSYCQKLQLTHMPTVIGRCVVDPYEIIKKDPWIKFKRYNLNTVAKEMLGEGKVEMDGLKEMRELWYGNREKLEKFVNYAKKDSELAMRLVKEKGLLDKFFELAKISGLLLQDSLGGQAQRHECRLLHEFRDRNILMPCKPDDAELRKRNIEREEAGLKGATVLEPEVGLHKNGCTLVLDFKSLYPSLITAFNICPTTLIKDKNPGEFNESPLGVKFVKSTLREGVIPKIVKELVETRYKVRSLIKTETDPEKKRIMNAKQLALKDMANSLYGYTGYIRGRIYVMDVANTITAYGRMNIERTKKLIEGKYPHKVIYGDTDSLFVKTEIMDLEIAEKLGNDVSGYVTDNLEGLTLQFEKLFKTFLILTKKRYAGWSFENNKDGIWKDKLVMKGIETVRRDWCTLTSDTMLKTLEIILKEGDIPKASKYVRSIVHDLTKGLIPLEKLAVVKGITKSLQSYDGIQPHVELAKKIIKRDPTRQNIIGERLEYVIIKGNQLLSKRSEEIAYVKEKNLDIDPKYYIQNQILPPLERIFEVCGVTSSELLEGVKQKSLFDIINGDKQKSPEETVLDSYDAVSCSKCSWNFTRPTLSGNCPKCNSQLYFSYNGSIGKFVRAM